MRGLLALLAALLLIPTAQAVATPTPVTIVLAGTGSGAVTSASAGLGGHKLECSNLGNPGGPGEGVCSETFETTVSGTKIELTETAGGGPKLFEGWTGASNGTCKSPSKVVTCSFTLIGATTVTATFRFPPALPKPITEGNSPGPSTYLLGLEGSVDPEGETVEGCRFEYGPDTGYGLSAPCQQSAATIGKGTEPVAVSGLAELEQLAPSTTYHYRLAAENPGGGVSGEDRTFSTGPAPASSCSNAAIRATQPFAALLMPDCMALEMASPAQKNNLPAKLEVAGQVSADGNRVGFNSLAALGGTPTVINPSGDPYVATRTPSGWQTSATSPPAGYTKGWYTYATAKSFSPDLSSWFQVVSTAPQSQRGEGQAFAAGLGGAFTALSPLLAPTNLTSLERAQPVAIGNKLEGASADRSHLFFRAGAKGALLPGDPTPTAADLRPNSYVAHLGLAGEPSAELLARDRQGKVWGGSCGATLGALEAGSKDEYPSGNFPARSQGAISTAGSRTYLSARASQPSSGSCDEANKLRILERRETESGPWIGELFTPECYRPDCNTADSNDHYQGASQDQSEVYIMSTRQLASSDEDSGSDCSKFAPSAGCDLYLYDSSLPAGHRLIQASAGEDVPGQHEAGKDAYVLNGVTGISTDGSHAYYVALGALTNDPNPEGALPAPPAKGTGTLTSGSKNVSGVSASSGAFAVGQLIAGEGIPAGTTIAVVGAGTLELSAKATTSGAKALTAGRPNLYLWDRESEETSFISTLANSDARAGVPAPGVWGGDGTWRNLAYPVPSSGPQPDGHILAFQSKAQLSAEDADGTRSDVYRYDAAADELRCVSCRSPLPDSEPFEVVTAIAVDFGLGSIGQPLGTDFAEQVRWVSEDGETVAFKTAESLVSGDVNGATDSYLWREGGFYRLPGTADPQGKLADKPVLSHDGSEVAFQSTQRLLGSDVDGAVDVYLARAGGGFALPAASPTPCEEEACQGPTQAAPPAPGVASAGLLGTGNVKPASPTRGCPKGKRPVRRKGKASCAAKHRKHKRANPDRRAAE